MTQELRVTFEVDASLTRAEIETLLSRLRYHMEVVKIEEESEIYGNEPTYVDTCVIKGDVLLSRPQAIERIKGLIAEDEDLDINNYPTDDDILDVGFRLYQIYEL